MNLKYKVLQYLEIIEIYQYYFGRFYENGVCILNEKISFCINNIKVISFFLFEQNNEINWCSEVSREQGDVFKLLEKCYRLNSYETVMMIDFDFDLKLIPNNRKRTKSNFNNYSVSYNDFENLDERINRVIKPILIYNRISYDKELYDFLLSYTISKRTLEKYEIFPISYCEIKTFRQQYIINSSTHFPLFAYRYSEILKVISPHFQGQTNSITYGGRIGSRYIFGFKQVIPKVEKLFLVDLEIDVLIFSELGYHAVCICGYKPRLTKELFEELRIKAKNIIYVYFDDKSCSREKVKSLKKHFNIDSINLKNQKINV